MYTSLLDYAHTSLQTPSPLPREEYRRKARRGGYPVGLLPLGRLAEDLRRRGVTYRRGLGYAIRGGHVEPDAVARLAADVLDEAATRIPTGSVAAYRRLADEALRAADEIAEATLDAVDDLPERTFGVLYDVCTRSEYEVARRLLARAEDPAEIMADERRHGERYGLQHTANDLRTSGRARRELLEALRGYLPEPEETFDDVRAAVAFLAAFDRLPFLRQSDLTRGYEDERRPGTMAKSALLALARERWGEARARSGYPTFRPAYVTPAEPAALPPRAPYEPLHPVPYRTAVEIVVARLLRGAATTVPDLLALLPLDEDEARHALDEGARRYDLLDRSIPC